MSNHSDTSSDRMLPAEISDLPQVCPVCEAKDEVSEIILIARIARDGLIRDERDTLGYAYRCLRGHRFRVMLEPDRERDG